MTRVQCEPGIVPVGSLRFSFTPRRLIDDVPANGELAWRRDA